VDVGFIGLGAMGSAVARRLADSTTLRVADLRPEAVQALVEAGARASDATDIAQHCDVVITCLPRSEDVGSLMTGLSGLANTMPAGGVVIDMTTGDPSIDRELTELLAPRGIRFVDAPVSGGPQAAAAGTLSIMVGATEQDFERVRPLLARISPNVLHAGPPGCGHVLKLANNLLSATNRLAAFEAIALAVAGGMDVGTAVTGINQSSGRSYITESTFPRFLLNGSIQDQNFAVGLMLKDVALANKVAADRDSQLDICAVTLETLRAAADKLGAHADINQIAQLIPPLAKAIETRNDFRGGGATCG